LADSLPDKFGNAVIDQWLASQGRTSDSFNVVERLCYTGKRGMGALEYFPAISPNGDKNEKINISKLVDFASAVLQGREGIHLSAGEDINYDQLLKLGTCRWCQGESDYAYNEEKR
jgi:serine/threonine-protein kinase HipA